MCPVVLFLTFCIFILCTILQKLSACSLSSVHKFLLMDAYHIASPLISELQYTVACIVVCLPALLLMVQVVCRCPSTHIPQVSPIQLQSYWIEPCFYQTPICELFEEGLCCYNSTPIFPFPCSHVLTCLQFPHHLPMCSYHVPPDYRTLSYLCCTYMHYPICSCPCLVPYSCAATSYHIPLTHLSLTHLFPSSIIHLPHLVCFLIPIHISDTSHFTFIRGLMLLSLILYYT